MALSTCTDEEILRHYELLQLDILDKVYLPYMKRDFRWTNEEKRYILQEIKNADRKLFPNEIKQLLSEHKQKINPELG